MLGSQNRMNLFSATVLFLPLLQAGVLAFVFCLCLDLYHSEEDHHGCLVKENSQVSAGYYGKQLKKTPSSNVEDCSEACTERDECDTFSVDNSKNCRLYRKGTIYSGSSTAGFCPKGIISLAAKTYSQKFLTLICFKRKRELHQQWR